MAELTIIDDTAVELAVIVDTDTFKPLRIVAAGENRVNLLQGFIDSVPFDLTLLNDDALRDGFAQFLEQHGALPTTPVEPPADGTVGSSDGNAADDEAALAEREAIDATDTPAEQPNDTDQAASTPAAAVEVDCYNCNGTGKIDFGDGAEAVRCNVCGGTGRRMAEVQA